MSTRNERIAGTLKKFIYEGAPIIIGIPTTISYFTFENPNDRFEFDKYRDTVIYGYHAMTIIGYDDDKYGGAFQIMNSLTEKKSSPAIFWMRYSDLLALTNDFSVLFDFGKENGMVNLKGENGISRIQGEVCKNKKCGPWKTYDQNGKLISIVNYREGVRHGEATVYFPNGKIRSKCLFNRGKQHKEFMEWDEKGECIAKGEFMMGKGTVEYHFGDYTAKGEELYGFSTGEWYFSHKRKKLVVGYYSEGKKHGGWGFYDQKERLLQTVTLYDEEIFHANLFDKGVKTESIDMSYGLMHGSHQLFYSNGRTKAFHYYEYGVIKSSREYDEKSFLTFFAEY